MNADARSACLNQACYDDQHKQPQDQDQSVAVLVLVWYGMVWYGILGFNVPLDTVQVISETGALSSDVHLPFSNGGPAAT